MAVTIKFDNNHLPLEPTLVLAEKNGHKLGKIPAIHINFADHLNSASELQFNVNKIENDIECPIWDLIVDFKLVWAKEWDTWFEIKVEIEDSESIIKKVSCIALGEAELSQINLYDIQINTEEDISRGDYIPTVLYNNVERGGSLLHRITQKAPHYTIGHVDETIAGIQRTFTFDNTSLMDAFNQIAEEIDCLFIIDNGSTSSGKPARIINVYDLENVCQTCGYRGVFTGNCPNCDSADIIYGYGENTNIYISPENLTDRITYTSNADSVKNCFRLVGGDDLMTAVIASCNPNGSSYLWYIPSSMRVGMSAELQAKLTQYDALYEYYRSRHVTTLSSSLVNSYNTLIDKYSVYSEDLVHMPTSIVGHAALMAAYYNAIDFEMYLTHELMPTPVISGKTAQTELAKLTATNLSPTAVTSISTCSESTASSAIQIAAKAFVDKNYQVKVSDTSLTTISSTQKKWRGKFTVTSYSDEEDTAQGGFVDIIVNDDQETYLKQRLKKVMADESDDITDISGLFALELTRFKAEIKKYCLKSLNSFHDACQACLDLLLESGVADEDEWSGSSTDLYMQMYKPYYDKLIALESEILLRENEIAIVAGKHDEQGHVTKDGIETLIQSANNTIHNALDFEKYVGSELYKEMAAYRREDTYENNNYISDGLSNDDLVSNALEFISRAEVDIYKAAKLQHSISASLKNLLVMKEFAPIVDAFSVGNWLSIRVDNGVYRLRLVSYEINYDNLEDLEVDFSDVTETINGLSDAESIFKSAASMATSYDSVKRQAGRGSKSQDTLSAFGNRGLPLTAIKIVDNTDEQNISIDEHGILARVFDQITETYSGNQLKINNTGLYITKDRWKSACAAIGKFKYYDPADGLTKEDYGVVANVLIGNYILSSGIGVYNENGSIKIDKDGILLISDVSGTTNVFRVRRRAVNGTLSDVIWFDNDGNAHFAGVLEAASGTFAGTVSASCIVGGTLSVDVIGSHSLPYTKLSGKLVGGSNNSWELDFTNGTFKIGNISANNINAGTLSANYIKGGVLSLGETSDNKYTTIDGTTGEIDIYFAGRHGYIYGGQMIIENFTSRTRITDGYIRMAYTTTGEATYPGEYSVNISAMDGMSFESNTENGLYPRISLKNTDWGSYCSIRPRQVDFNFAEQALYNIKPMRFLMEQLSAQISLEASSIVLDGVKDFYNGSIWVNTKSDSDSYPGGYVDLHTDEFLVKSIYENFSFKIGSSYSGESNEIRSISDYWIHEGEMLVVGDFSVGNGTKSRIVSTDQYFDRSLYCYETPSPMFGDVGEGVVGADGLCYISIDAIFSQTITTSQYQVFIQKYGNGDCWVRERKNSYFVIEGTPGLAFGWELKAKQKDFDQRRLDMYQEKVSLSVVDYSAMAEQHIKDIQKEREKQ